MAPTPVQTRAIPVLQAGRDLFAQAQTGTGKTAAFAIPILEKVEAALKRPQALVVVPTRELALQVTREFGAIGKYRKSHEVAIYGGVPYGPQERALARGTQIVVGTPGRLLDHIGKGNPDLSGLLVVVLDEADRLLDMGFAPEVRRLLRRAPERRQTALFSATLGADVRELAGRFSHNAGEVAIEPEKHDADSIDAVHGEGVERHEERGARELA